MTRDASRTLASVLCWFCHGEGQLASHVNHHGTRHSVLRACDVCGGRGVYPLPPKGPHA